jgi:hypothetical protein
VTKIHISHTDTVPQREPRALGCDERTHELREVRKPGRGDRSTARRAAAAGAWEARRETMHPNLILHSHPLHPPYLVNP